MIDMVHKTKRILSVAAGLLLGVTSFLSFFKTPERLSAGAEGTTATVNESIVDTYVDSEVKLLHAPSVVCDVTNQTVLDGLKTAVETNSARPSNAILRLNENCEVVGATGEKLGDFQTVFTDVLAGKIIPVAYVQTESAADALIAFLNEKIDILDMSVMSDKPALVKKVREAKTGIRGVLSFTAETELADIVKTSNLHHASTIVLPASAATLENVRYLQTRTKAVWVATENDGRLHLNDCIHSGALGLITSDYANAYSVYKTYEESLCRTPVNIGRRGVVKLHNENSRLGTKKAIEYGANVVALDAQLTKDDVIVLIQDLTLDRTTDGTGYVKDYTYEELKEFKLDLIEGDEETIPTLDDIMPLFEDTDAVLLLDIKNKSDTGKIETLLREKIVAYDFFDKIVVASSNDTVSDNIKEVLPEVSITISGTQDNSAGFLRKLNKYNGAGNAAYNKKTQADAQRFLTDRGLYSTYYNVTWGYTMDEFTQLGAVNFLTDDVSYYKTREMFVEGKKELARKDLAVGNTIPLSVTTYSGAIEEKSGEVVYLEDKGTYWQVIASYKGKLGVTLYTQSFAVEKSTEQSPSVDSSGASSASSTSSGSSESGEQDKPQSYVWWIIAGAALVLVGIGVGTYFLCRKKH